MKKIHLVVLSCLVSLIWSCSPNTFETEYVIKEMNVIPMPNRIERVKGDFLFSHDSKVIVPIKNKEVLEVAKYFVNRLNASSSLEIPIVDTTVVFRESFALFKMSKDKNLGEEGFKIEAVDDHVIIEAATKKGFFNAVQAIMQLLPHEIFFPERTAGILCKIPNLIIEDKPALRYRGLHLDVANYFAPVQEVKQYIDLLAMHRLNVLHLYLANEDSCRIELKKYPQLNIKNDTTARYYTQEELKDIVEYARHRCITIVPEFDFFGNMKYLKNIKADLCCKAQNNENKCLLCMKNSNALNFALDVLSEMIDVFPSEMIQLGGSNSMPNSATCSICPTTPATSDFTDSISSTPLSFQDALADFLAMKNRKAVVWESLLTDSLSDKFIIMARNESNVVKAVKSGHQVIYTPDNKANFSYYQADKDIEPKAIMGLNRLENVYDITPIPEELTDTEQTKILGLQGCLWTDEVHSFDDIEHLLLPRISALSEVCWVHKHLHFWDDFKVRLVAQYRRYQNMRVNYRVPTPIGMIDGANFINDTIIKLDNPMGKGKIYYTLNGQTPGKASNSYTAPLQISKTSVFRARVSTYTGMGSVDLSAAFFKTEPNAEYKHGLKANYYNKNFSKTIDELETATPAKSFMLFNNNYFNNIATIKDITIVADGFLKVDKPGKYKLHIGAFDKSIFYLDGKKIIEISGDNHYKEEFVEVQLDTNYHSVKYIYCEDVLKQAFGIYIEGEQIKKQEISAQYLYHK